MYRTGEVGRLARLEAVVLVLLAQLGAREGQVCELVACHRVHAPGMLQRLRRGQPLRRVHVQQVPNQVLRSAEARSSQAIRTARGSLC